MKKISCRSEYSYKGIVLFSLPFGLWKKAKSLISLPVLFYNQANLYILKLSKGFSTHVPNMLLLEI